MLLAGIAPEEIAETLGISVVGLEPRLWETVRALGRLDANPRPTQRDRQRPPLVARSAGR